MPSKQAWEYSRRCDGEDFKKNLKTVIKIRPKQAWVVENKKKGDFEMTNKEKHVLIDGLRKLAADVADLASMLEGAESTPQKQDVPTEEPAPVAAEAAPAKEYTFEEARAILAEKVRKGFRAEVKAILNAHGVKQLSDIEDAHVLDAIVAEAEVIGNG